MEGNDLLAFDPLDYAGMIKMMDKYGDSEMPFFGKNENGEDVIISVSKDSISVRTFQKNGWLRRNVYNLIDGDIVSEELFEGKT